MFRIRSVVVWGAAVVAALASAPVLADDGPGRVALGVKGSSLGVGADLTIGVVKSLNVRLNGNVFKLNRTVKISDIDYDGTVDLKSALALLDFHPGGAGFRISVGGGWTGNKIDGSTPKTGTFVVNGVSYDASQVGRIEGEVKPNSYGLYAGLGYGNAVAKGSPVKFIFDLGVLYHGEPKVTLTPVAGSSTFPAGYLANVAIEQQKGQDDVSKYKFYPVLSMGLSYRF